MALGITVALVLQTRSLEMAVKKPLLEKEPAVFRISAPRHRLLGDEVWVDGGRRLNLESTMRPRSRKQVRFPKEEIKEA